MIKRSIPKETFFLISSMAKDFVDVYEVSIFADVMCCTANLCVVMLMIQIEILVEFP